MRPNKTKPNRFVGIFIKARRGVRRVVITGVFEGIKPHIAAGHRAAFIRLSIDAQRRGRFAASIGPRHPANRGEQPTNVPAPGRELGLFHPARNIGINRRIRPREHRLIIGQDAPEAADRRDVRYLISIINMMIVGGRDGPTHDLMNANQKFGC